MTTYLCENLGTTKVKRIVANEVAGDTEASATNKDLTLTGTNIILQPTVGNVQVVGTLSVNDTSVDLGSFTFQNSTISAPGTLTIDGETNVRVGDVTVSGSTISSVTGPLSLTAPDNAVRVESVTFADGAVNTTTGALTLSSQTGIVQVCDVAVFNDTLTSNADSLHLDAVVDVRVDKDLYLHTGVITTPVDTDLQIAPGSGVVRIVGELQVDGVLNSVDTMTTNLQVDDKTITLADGAVDNVKGDGAGLLVAGNAAYGPRALTWNMGTAETNQDKGGYTGSYWHLEGGQFMISRTIAQADRKAPGTEVLLSQLASGADTYRWEFTGGSDVSNVGARSFDLLSGIAWDNGMLIVSGTASVDNLTLAATYTVVVKVIPQTDMSAVSGEQDIIFSGDVGIVLLNNGHVALKHSGGSVSSTAVVGADPLVAALVIAGTSASVYVNGVQAVSPQTVTLTGSQTLSLLHGASGGAVGFDDLRIINGVAVTDANTLLYGWREMYAEPKTVTYGFRIADDESLEVVKVRGSNSTSRVFHDPAPCTVTGSNDMGSIADAAADVIMRTLN